MALTAARALYPMIAITCSRENLSLYFQFIGKLCRFNKIIVIPFRVLKHGTRIDHGVMGYARTVSGFKPVVVHVAK